MYNAKIITDSGSIFEFGYENGIVFDIKPLSGIDVSLNKSQGFNQIGESIEAQSVKGLRRTIKGIIFKDADEISEMMLSALPAFTTGRLIYNDTYYCDIVVDKTPAISHPIGKKCTFTMSVYCATPFWYTLNQEEFVINEWVPAFSFPVTYDSHKFGTKSADAAINAYNNGDIETPFEVVFKCMLNSVSNFGIIDMLTLEKLSIKATLEQGESAKFYRKNGVFKLEKTLTVLQQLLCRLMKRA